MHRVQKAYLLKDRDFVVTDKSSGKNAKDEEFTEVTLSIPVHQIEEWATEMDEIE